MSTLSTPSFRMSLGTQSFHGNANARRVMAIEVQQVTDAPSTFTVKLDDRDHLFSRECPIREGHSATIALGYVGRYALVMEGEVTRVEVQHELGGRKTFIVEGQDGMRRLKRGRGSRSWNHMRDSEVLVELAQAANLGVDIERTPVVHPYILKNAQSDFNFLLERVKRNGWTVFCEGRTLVFKQPYQGEPVCTLTRDANSVIRGSDQRVLQKLSFSASSDKLPSEVVVRHYDPNTKRKIEGICHSLDLQDQGSWKSAHVLTGGSGKTVVITDQPVRSIEEAEVLAGRRMVELSDEVMRGQGQCEGDGRIRAGKVVAIEAAGELYDGHYYIVECTHRFDTQSGPGGGYSVTFMAQRARQAGTLAREAA